MCASSCAYFASYMLITSLVIGYCLREVTRKQAALLSCSLANSASNVGNLGLGRPQMKSICTCLRWISYCSSTWSLKTQSCDTFQVFCCNYQLCSLRLTHGSSVNCFICIVRYKCDLLYIMYFVDGHRQYFYDVFIVLNLIVIHVCLLV